MKDPIPLGPVKLNALDTPGREQYGGAWRKFPSGKESSVYQYNFVAPWNKEASEYSRSTVFPSSSFRVKVPIFPDGLLPTMVRYTPVGESPIRFLIPVREWLGP